MRLIDADALEKAIYEWMPKDQETYMDSEIPPIENLVVSIMMTIQEQPTVEAIPVEFIKDLHKEAIEYRDHFDSFWQAPAWDRADNQAIGINSVLQVWEDRNG